LVSIPGSLIDVSNKEEFPLLELKVTEALADNDVTVDVIKDKNMTIKVIFFIKFFGTSTSLKMKINKASFHL
jgi:hypothetical protein